MRLTGYPACRVNQRFYRRFERTGDADRKSTRLNSSHSSTSYAAFCLKKKMATATPVGQATSTPTPASTVSPSQPPLAKATVPANVVYLIDSFPALKTCAYSITARDDP